MTIYNAHYKDQPAVTLESDVLRVQFLPTIGAKLCSLVYKPLNRELMVQNPSANYLLQPYDGHYESAECSGFDDMFPTIDTCYYEAYPWQGTKMADHGEVWSLAWGSKIENDQLALSTYGVRFPYKLDKQVFFAAPHILRMEYTLTNLSDFDFQFLWAAHTMINLEDKVELVLPTGVERVVSCSHSGSMGGYGLEAAWPQFTQADGSARDLSRLRPISTGKSEKYYVKGALPEGWCGLKYHASDFALALSFPVKTVPYLGVLPNEGGWRGIHNIFLEPATASFDRPDVARLRGEGSVVRARSTYAWYLNISLAEGVGFHSVSEAGEFS